MWEKGSCGTCMGTGVFIDGNPCPDRDCDSK